MWSWRLHEHFPADVANEPQRLSQHFWRNLRHFYWFTSWLAKTIETVFRNAEKKKDLDTLLLLQLSPTDRQSCLPRNPPRAIKHRSTSSSRHCGHAGESYFLSTLNEVSWHGWIEDTEKWTKSYSDQIKKVYMSLEGTWEGKLASNKIKFEAHKHTSLWGLL